MNAESKWVRTARDFDASFDRPTHVSTPPSKRSVQMAALRLSKFEDQQLPKANQNNSTQALNEELAQDRVARARRIQELEGQEHGRTTSDEENQMPF